MDNELAYAFNRWIASEYSRKAVNIACRFTDLKCQDWEKKSCIWHEKYNFGYKAPKDDVYIKDDKERRHSVDAIVLSKEEMSPIAQFIYDGWCGEKKRIESRDSEPVIIIAKPPPNPPMPKPVELPPQEPKPEPKKNPAPWIVKASVWTGILGTIAGVVTLFVPAAKPWVMTIVAILEALFKALGV